MEVSIASTRRALARRAPVVVLIAFGLLAFALIFALGGPTVARGLDPSWTEVLAWGFLQHVQWGRDLVFTYGPLGFLQPYSSYVRGIFWWFAAGQIVLPAFFAVVAALLLRRCTLGQLLLFALAFICWCSQLAGDITWALTLLFTATLLIERDAVSSRAAFYVLAVALAPVFAVIALAKFSLLPLWMLCVAGIVASCVLQRRLLRAAACAAIFVAALLGVWAACGQRLENLPLFLLRGFQLSAGYGHAMGNDAPFLYEVLALLICAVLLATCAWSLWKSRTQHGAMIVAGLVAAATVLFWLACFTRGDHWPWFFTAIALIPFALLGSRALAADAFVRRSVYAISVVAILVALRTVPPSVILAQLSIRPQNTYANLQNLPEIERQRDQIWTSVAKTADMPKTRARIGNNRVDLLTWEQGMVLANGFNYAPRPVFQSYVAFTPTLARLNESYFLGPAAPDFVIFKLDYIDGRVPMSEDGLALIALLKRYHPVLSERGFLLLQRDAAAPPAVATLQTGATVAAKLGVDIPVKPGKTPTLGFFHVELSAFGKLYTVLFREPVLNLVVKTAKGEVRHRLVRATAESGFLVNPLVESNNDWVNLYFDRDLPQIESLRIEPESKWDRPIFREDISVAFQPVETLHADPASVSTQLGGLILYPGFDLMPTDDVEFRTVVEDDQESVFLHAPAKMTFKPKPGRYTLTATYGVQNLAVRDAGCQRSKPDGVGIGVVVKGAAAEKELIHVDVDPFHAARDAGPHKLALPPFDVSPGDVVEYRVDAGPAGNNLGCDWTYVRDMVFVRQLQAVGKPGAASPAARPAAAANARAGFNIMPVTAGLRFIDEQGKDSMFLHAPSAVDFQPAPGRYDIAATFGVQSIAVGDPGCAKADADGVGVSVVLRHGGRQSMLRHVEIDPFHVPGDRGPRELTIRSVDIAAGDVLSYRVDPGHGGSNTSCDWTYVRDFHVDPLGASGPAGAPPRPRSDGR